MRPRLLFLPLLAALAVFLAAPSAGAHTDFESSDPADGAVEEGPVDTITIVFTAPSEPAGDGFEVLGPAGEPRAPSSVTSEDGRTFVLRFDPPLAGGIVGVRWSVRAGDAHPIDGSFSFTAGTASESATTAPAAQSDPGTPDTSTPTDSTPADGTPAESDELEEFLGEEDDTGVAGALAAAGRILGLLGVMFGVGAAAFAAWVLRGDRVEIRMVLAWVRRFATLAVLGTALQLVAEVVLADAGDWGALASTSAWGDLLGSTLGVALLLRMAGGVLLGFGATGTPGAHAAEQRWHPTALAASGAALLLGSFLFDGHTVSEGNRVLHSVVDLVHVASAAVWAGGVLMLGLVVRGRRREGNGARTCELAARFSVVATVAIVAAGLAGIVMSVIVLDSPSELWSTGWGRLLLVKVALVAVAGAIGAWNHFVMVPELEDHPDDRSVVDRFSAVLRVEAVAVVGVVVVTGLLVGSSPT